MGPTGTGSLEEGDASGEIFWMDHEDFVTYYYRTFPPAVPEEVDIEEDDEEADDNLLPGGDEERPKSRSQPQAGDSSIGEADRAAPIYKFFKLESDTLIQLGRDTGMYMSKYTCNIACENGVICGAARTIKHKFGKYGINSNLHSHIGVMAKNGCPNHQAALIDLDDTNQAKGTDADGNTVKKMNFAEAFTHHIDATWMRSSGLVSGIHDTLELLFTQLSLSGVCLYCIL